MGPSGKGVSSRRTLRVRETAALEAWLMARGPPWKPMDWQHLAVHRDKFARNALFIFARNKM